MGTAIIAALAIVGGAYCGEKIGEIVSDITTSIVKTINEDNKK